MHLRWALCLLLCSVCFGCGGSSAVAPDLAVAGDAGTVADLGHFGDAGTSDGSIEDASVPSDGANGDMAEPGDMTLAPFQIAYGHFQLLGVTSDGYAVYRNLDSGTIEAIAITGGAPLTISSAGAGMVTIEGKVVLVYVPNPAYYLETIWTKDDGPKTVTDRGEIVAVRGDGSYVAYAYRTPGETTWTLVFVPPSLAVRRTVTLPKPPHIGFVGDVLVAGYFSTDPSVGGTISSFDPSTGTKLLDLFTNTDDDFWVANAGGTRVMGLERLTRTPKVIPVGGGSTVRILGHVAADPVNANAPEFYFADDASSVVFVDSSEYPSTLMRATLANPVNTPTALAPRVSSIYMRSPDFSKVFVGQEPSTAWKLGLAPTDGPGTIANIPCQTNKWPEFWLGFFTPDSSRLVYWTDTQVVNGENLTGILTSSPYSSADATVHASDSYNGFSADGTKVVYNEGYAVTSLTRGEADIKVVDIASLDSPVEIAAGADAEFFLAPARDKVVLTYDGRNALPGIYVKNIP